MGPETGRAQLNTDNGISEVQRRFYNETPTLPKTAKGSSVSKKKSDIKVGIDYGSESGGLFDFFKKNDESEADDTPDFSDIGAYHDKMLERSNALLENSKSNGREDSDEMAMLKSSVRFLLGALNKEIPSEQQAFMVALMKVRGAYYSAIDSCNAYIAHIRKKHGGIFSEGRSRLNLVTNLLEQYKKEQYAIEPAAKEMHDKADGSPVGTWSEVLKTVRMETIDLNDGSTKAVGDGGASLLFKRTSSTGKTEFLKAEERLPDADGADSAIDMFLSATGGRTSFLKLFKAMEEYYDQHKKDFGRLSFGQIMHDLCSRMYNNTPVYTDSMGQYDPEYYINRFVKNDDVSIRAMVIETVIPDAELQNQWVAMHTSLSKKEKETNVATTRAGIMHGDVVSDRNESTSRLAKAYGISDLIASSRTVLIDHGDGVVTKANAMEEAAGMSMGDLEAAIKAKKNVSIDVCYTPQSLMQMFMLEVFDLISGQIDRHKYNYHVTVDPQIVSTDPPKEKWYITSIKGIDNDLAFGLLDYNTMANSDNWGVPIYDATQSVAWGMLEGGKERTLTDMTKAPNHEWEKGNLAIHYLPRSFYNRILDYTPDMARVDLMDTRETDELDYLENRILAVRQILENAVASGGLIIVEDDFSPDDPQAVEKAAMMNAQLEAAYDRSVSLYQDADTRPYSSYEMYKGYSRGVYSSFVHR